TENGITENVVVPSSVDHHSIQLGIEDRLLPHALGGRAAGRGTLFPMWGGAQAVSPQLIGALVVPVLRSGEDIDLVRSLTKPGCVWVGMVRCGGGQGCPVGDGTGIVGISERELVDAA